MDEKGLHQTIGRQLRQRRLSLGMTQREVASALNLERSSIANIESGLQRPPIGLLYRLCSVLDMEPAGLLPPLATVVLASSNIVAEQPRVIENSRLAEQLLTMPSEAATLANELLTRLREDDERS